MVRGKMILERLHASCRYVVGDFGSSIDGIKGPKAAIVGMRKGRVRVMV